MFFSSHDAARPAPAEPGLTVHVNEVVTVAEPEGPASFQWVIAAKPVDDVRAPGSRPA
jgi:hypothetical protein